MRVTEAERVSHKTHIAIYAIDRGIRDTGYIRLAIQRLAEAYDRIDVIVHPADAERYKPLLDDIAPFRIQFVIAAVGGMMALYRAGIIRVFAERDLPESVLLTGSAVFGPVLGADDPRRNSGPDICAGLLA